MNDAFHPDLPDAFIVDIFAVMADTPRHTYQLLTKRPQRLVHLSPRLPFLPNVWLVTSVESQAVVNRIGWLRAVPALVRFQSCKPTLIRTAGAFAAG
ncbi:MAG TPA: hypothetical protein DD856_16180 [Sulfobacillus sp.]|jgi:protein gp37|nr:hypothetical protein [Sulfobacillus sp.]